MSHLIIIFESIPKKGNNILFFFLIRYKLNLFGTELCKVIL